MRKSEIMSGEYSKKRFEDFRGEKVSVLNHLIVSTKERKLVVLLRIKFFLFPICPDKELEKIQIKKYDVIICGVDYSNQ